MVRTTPLPLLRNLPANVPVVRCQLCHELVLNHEMCHEGEEHQCPRRRQLEPSELPRAAGSVQHPERTDRLDA